MILPNSSREETRPLDVHVRVDLPPDVAEQVEVLQEENPELLSRLVLGALTRLVVFDTLMSRQA